MTEKNHAKVWNHFPKKDQNEVYEMFCKEYNMKPEELKFSLSKQVNNHRLKLKSEGRLKMVIKYGSKAPDHNDNDDNKSDSNDETEESNKKKEKFDIEESNNNNNMDEDDIEDADDIEESNDNNNMDEDYFDECDDDSNDNGPEPTPEQSDMFTIKGGSVVNVVDEDTAEYIIEDATFLRAQNIKNSLKLLITFDRSKINSDYNDSLLKENNLIGIGVDGDTKLIETTMILANKDQVEFVNNIDQELGHKSKKRRER